MILNPALTAQFFRKGLIANDFFALVKAHLRGELATRPIARLPCALASWLVVVRGDPAASSRLAGTHRRCTLGHVQRLDLG